MGRFSITVLLSLRLAERPFLERNFKNLLNEVMLLLVCLVAPPPYPHYLCYRYFCRYSCAISGVYNSVVRLMPDISSHFSDNYRSTSGGHLPRVGFPCFLELTGNLTGNVFFFEAWERLNLFKCPRLIGVF